uniref:Uncharacterized protein n=1 Tax=Physcomitrium patens TaxID=3218 RepID=A0A2K1JLZ2_PHYPA|nr:hypothetical protein PHYPA_017388 [Physcomitrium patens]
MCLFDISLFTDTFGYVNRTDIRYRCLTKIYAITLDCRQTYCWGATSFSTL